MAQFTLDDIRAAADAKYGSTDIELKDGTVVKLLNPLRLPKDNRDQLVKLQDELQADGADQEALLSKGIRLIAERPFQAEALLESVNGDLAVLATIFENYTEGTQAGEA